MITIYNRQRTYDIDTRQLRNDIAHVLEYLGCGDCAVSVWMTTHRTIRIYNRTFRGKDNATDVLSFPFHPELKPGEDIAAEDDEERVLGDIIISAEHVARQARERDIPFYNRLRRIVVHGICHLLGYDHQTEAEYRQMITREKQLLQLFDHVIHD